jgi:hypothetical protein
MTIPHLNDDELNRAVLDEELPAAAAEHLEACLVCRRRRDDFLALVEQARGEDPDEETRARVREGALAAWSGVRVPHHWLRWVAAAAAVILLGVLPLLHSHAPTPVAFNSEKAEAVMTEVNQVLDRDPLSAVVSEDMVNTVVPVPQQAVERSVS